MCWWVLLLPLTSLWAMTGWPAWVVMCCISVSILVLLKTKVLLEFAKHPGRRLTMREVAGWYLGWPGLNAREFFDSPTSPVVPVQIREWLVAILKTSLGVLLLIAGQRVLAYEALAGGWIAMVGIVMVLHFGGFHVLALLWRQCGRTVRPIMFRPLLATSVSDFWSNRWNLAFRDFANQFVMRPLTRRWNSRFAMWACFTFSGFVHELAISVPAGGGFGLPTGYFLLQALGASFERSTWGQRMGLRSHGRGWLFTLLVAGPPAFFLFHPPFVLNVIVPMVTGQVTP